MSQDQDLSSLLDASIGDLAELPESVVFAAGAHRCTFDYEVRQSGGESKIPMFCIKLKHQETLELNNPEKDTAPNTGDETEVKYNMNNEYGQAALRSLAALFCKHQGLDEKTTSLNGAFQAYKGGSLVFVTKTRADKKDPARHYADIVTVIFD